MTEHGRPFTSAGFGNWMRERCSEAELRHGSAHGFRKACSRRLAESGCTLNEIKSITGHKADAEVRRYTDKADQQLLATSAVKKLKDAATKCNSANHQNNVSKHKGTFHVNQ